MNFLLFYLTKIYNFIAPKTPNAGTKKIDHRTKNETTQRASFKLKLNLNKKIFFKNLFLFTFQSFLLIIK